MEISDKEYKLGKAYSQPAKDILNFICNNKKMSYSLETLLMKLRPDELPEYSSEDKLITMLGKGAKELLLLNSFRKALETLENDEMIESKPIIDEKGFEKVAYICKKRQHGKKGR